MTDNNEFNDFTLFDIFIKNELLYLILSINIDPVRNEEIDVRVNNISAYVPKSHYRIELFFHKIDL
jgi:hypothetical protein